jgi:hypothetical protein
VVQIEARGDRPSGQIESCFQAGQQRQNSVLQWIKRVKIPIKSVMSPLCSSSMGGGVSAKQGCSLIGCKQNQLPMPLYWVAQPDSATAQLRQFSQALYRFEHPEGTVLTDFTYQSWEQAFERVARLAEGARFTLIIDDSPIDWRKRRS